MTIQFACPHCGTKTQVADQYAGQSGPCASCGKTVTIPYPGAASSKGGGGVAVTIMLVLGLVFGLLVLCMGAAGFVFFAGMRGAQTSAMRVRSMNNLRQIGLALHNYHDVYQSFPPAYVTDAEGNKLYSWRVLILPFVEEAPLYDQFNKNEAWDSPNNLPLTQRMPQVFRAPSNSGFDGLTNYAAIVGPEALFDPEKPTKISTITDGTSNTLMVVEIKGSTINWAEPRDVEFAKSSFTINAANDDLGSDNPQGCNVLMADGATRFLNKTTPPAVTRSMATKAGGEVVQIDGF